MTLYKVLDAGRYSCHGGYAQWEPGAWQPPVRDLAMCKWGYHLLDRPRQVLQWLIPGGQLWEAEGRGEHLSEPDKSVWEEARIVRQLHMPTRDELVALAADMAERVLPLWEAVYPADGRPRQAIAAARQSAHGAPFTATAAAHAAAHAAAYAADAYAADAADAAYAASAAAHAAYAATAHARAATAAYAGATAAAYAADAAYAASAAAHAAGPDELEWQDALVLEVIRR